MKFEEYENPEQLLQCLQQHIFDKKYDLNTVDLISARSVVKNI